MNTKSLAVASNFDWFSSLLKALLIALTIPAAAAGFVLALIMVPALIVAFGSRSALSAMRVCRKRSAFVYAGRFSGPTHTY